jgi:hypothetical protein
LSANRSFRRTAHGVHGTLNRPVPEVREPGRSLTPFEDFLEFGLSYGQLRNLFAYPEAHQEWRAQLSAVAGIYLILAEDTGDLYVGSATAEEGIWGRWKQYAKSGHGGNTKLRNLLRTDRRFPKGFRFSLLQMLPKTLARDRLLEYEGRYERKLGTRAVGLNMNGRLGVPHVTAKE